VPRNTNVPLIFSSILNISQDHIPNQILAQAIKKIQ